MADIFINKYM